MLHLLAVRTYCGRVICDTAPIAALYLRGNMPLRKSFLIENNAVGPVEPHAIAVAEVGYGVAPCFVAGILHDEVDARVEVHRPIVALDFGV